MSLLDAGERVVPAFTAPASARAARDLDRLGVTVREGVRVTEIDRVSGRLTVLTSWIATGFGALQSQVIKREVDRREQPAQSPASAPDAVPASERSDSD
ncbi:MAG TPA: hypothetical protein VE127_13415 [Solirubrobacteraceae bacterium]|nr:hypothetical protein [Solirubrobacteraceae bacterium]